MGASATASSTATDQSRPSTYRPAMARPAAVAAVPTMPSERMGRAARRAALNPVSRPPLNRMKNRATAPTRSSVTVDRSSVGAMPRAPAAMPTARNAAGPGRRKRAKSGAAASAAKRSAAPRARLGKSHGICPWEGDADQPSRHTRREFMSGPSSVFISDVRRSHGGTGSDGAGVPGHRLSRGAALSASRAGLTPLRRGPSSRPPHLHCARGQLLIGAADGRDDVDRAEV